MYTAFFVVHLQLFLKHVLWICMAAYASSFLCCIIVRSIQQYYFSHVNIIDWPQHIFLFYFWVHGSFIEVIQMYMDEQTCNNQKIVADFLNNNWLYHLFIVGHIITDAKLQKTYHFYFITRYRTRPPICQSPHLLWSSESSRHSLLLQVCCNWVYAEREVGIGEWISWCVSECIGVLDAERSGDIYNWLTSGAKSHFVCVGVDSQLNLKKIKMTHTKWYMN